MIWTRARTQRAAIGTAIVVGLLIAVAAAREPDVVVVTMEPVTIRPGVRGGRTAVPALTPATSETAESTCSSPQPIGTWSCQDGVWVAGIAPPADAPSGYGPGGCMTPSPGAGWNCRAGAWLTPGGGDTTDASRASPAAPDVAQDAAGTSTSSASGAIQCPVPSPGPDWTCQNGSWVVTAGSAARPQGSNTEAPNTCPPPAPTPGAVCQAGLWVIR